MKSVKKTVDKKYLERYFLEKFIEDSNEAIKISDIPVNDPPDFVITYSSKTISLEMTQLIDGETKQKEEYKKELIERAERKFKDKYNVSTNILQVKLSM